MEPLYKGQVGDRSLVPYTVKPLYKGQVGDRSLVPYAVKPLYKGQVGDRSLSSSQRYQMHYLGEWDLSFVQRFNLESCCNFDLKSLFSVVTLLLVLLSHGLTTYHFVACVTVAT